MPKSPDQPSSLKSEEVKIELINDPAFLKTAWPVTDFEGAYPEPGLTGCALAVEGDPSGDPDKTAMVALRTFIENSDRLKNDQKYIMAIRFYSFGDMATVDIISLDKGYHKDIAAEHLERLGWTSNEEQQGPYIFIGGHCNVNEQGQADFSSSSSRFGNDIFMANGNSIAAYAAQACGLKLGQTDKTRGAAFIKDLLTFMRKNKLKENFYELFINHIHDKDPEAYKSFTGQHLTGLITMKATDRALAEDDDINKMLVEETTDGLAKYALVSSVARKIKSKKA